MGAGSSSAGNERSILRIFPFFSGPDVGAFACSPISSRKLYGWTRRGDEGDAKDTRLCLRAETPAAEMGNGALKEKVDSDGRPLGPWEVVVLSVIMRASVQVKRLETWRTAGLRTHDRLRYLCYVKGLAVETCCLLLYGLSLSFLLICSAVRRSPRVPRVLGSVVM